MNIEPSDKQRLLLDLAVAVQLANRYTVIVEHRDMFGLKDEHMERYLKSLGKALDDASIAFIRLCPILVPEKEAA